MSLLEFVVNPKELETKNFPFSEYELEKIKLAKEWKKEVKIVIEIENYEHYILRALEILA